MGEKGVHLTGTAYVRPSLLEIVAQKSLASILEPAFSKLVSVGYVFILIQIFNKYKKYNNN